MLMIINFLPVGSSTIKNNTINSSTNIIDDGCRCSNQNENDDKYSGNLCYQYPVMNKQFSFNARDASVKPKIKDTPVEFSWRDYEGQDWMTLVKKQICGDCWDFAAIGTFESIINIREDCAKLNPDLSEQYVLSCLPSAGSCHGGSSYLAFERMMNTTEEGNYHNGAIPETCFPYQGNDDVPCVDKCPNWEERLIPLLNFGSWNPDGSSGDREAIKTQVMETGPVASHIAATSYFGYWGSTHHDPEEYFPHIGDVRWTSHVVIILGWKDDPSIGKGGYWICKNSWGTNWGYDGFFNIEYGSLSIDASRIVWVDYDPESIDWPPSADTGGLYFGELGQEIFFDGSNSFDAESDVSIYYWDFGDETTSSDVSPAHTYLQQGIYPVTLIVTDNIGNTDVDTTWAWVGESADQPNTPSITGPQRGTPGEEYEYTLLATDANGDDIYYYIDWGYYQSVGEWIGPYASGEPVTVNHTWDEKGTYIIKAKAKDVYDLESDWATLEVSMPKTKNKQCIHFGIILTFGFNVDVKIVQLEPGEDYVDLEVLNKPFYIWENEIETINSGAFIRLYSAKGLFLPSLPFCFGTCQDWGIIG